MSSSKLMSLTRGTVTLAYEVPKKWWRGTDFAGIVAGSIGDRLAAAGATGSGAVKFMPHTKAPSGTDFRAVQVMSNQVECRANVRDGQGKVQVTAFVRFEGLEPKVVLHLLQKEPPTPARGAGKPAPQKAQSETAVADGVAASGKGVEETAPVGDVPSGGTSDGGGSQDAPSGKEVSLQGFVDRKDDMDALILALYEDHRDHRGISRGRNLLGRVILKSLEALSVYASVKSAGMLGLAMIRRGILRPSKAPSSRKSRRADMYVLSDDALARIGAKRRVGTIGRPKKEDAVAPAPTEPVAPPAAAAEPQRVPLKAWPASELVAPQPEAIAARPRIDATKLVARLSRHLDAVERVPQLRAEIASLEETLAARRAELAELEADANDETLQALARLVEDE